MTGFVARDPDFEGKVRRSFANQSLMATLGMVLETVEPGLVRVVLPYGPHVLQQHGFIHGGATATIGDTAAGFAAISLIPPGSGLLTVEFKLSLMAPARGDRLVAIGRVIKPGRTLIFCEADITAEEGGEARPVAHMTATMMVLAGREGVVD